MLRMLAPAGARIPLPLVLRAAAGSFVAPTEQFPQMASVLGVRNVLAASSGRAALFLVLKTLSALKPGKTTVAIPAYTCYSVAAAVIRAGLKLLPVDLDPETLDFDYEQLERISEQSLLCIVTANLFGYVNDLRRLERIAAAKQAFLVDDAAQALAAERAGVRAGTAGDVGIYSLARGKGLPLGEGGLIVTNSEEIAVAVRSRIQALSAGTWRHSLALFTKVLLTSALLSPRLYWIPNSLPFLKLGVTEFDPNFPVAQLSRFSSSLLSASFELVTKLNDVRANNARSVAATVANNAKFTVPRPDTDCRPAWIRLPLLARDQQARDAAVADLRAAGFGASVYYPACIPDIPEAAPHLAEGSRCAGARDLARRLLTLPVHPLVRAADVRRMAEILAKSEGHALAHWSQAASRG